MKPKSDQPKELTVEFDGRHDVGWCVMFGAMIVSRHSTEEQARYIANDLNRRNRFTSIILEASHEPV